MMSIAALRYFLVLMSSFVLLAMSQDDDFDANIFMEKFGYLDDLPDHAHSEESVEAALEEYQRFMGLRVTGRLDGRTIRMMNRPRCGVPDVIKPGQRPLQLRSTINPNAPLAYNAPGFKWQNERVSYKWVSFTNKMRRGDQRRAIYNAFQKWSAVTPLNFVQSSGDADILLSFGEGDHGDGRGNSFDGPSGTLAHAFFPGGPGLAGDTHFDDAEPWTVNTDRGTDLEIVAAHEFGHALGLGHSSVPTALMAPVYRGYDPAYKLHQDDISGIQSLYGRGSAEPTTRPTTRPTRRTRPTTRPTRRTRPTTRPTRRTRPTTRPTRRTRPTTPRPTTSRPVSGTNNCNIRFKAVEQIQDGRVLAFVGREVYQVTRNGIANRVRTRAIFPSAPSNPGAVVYDRYRGYLYFFKGRRVWRYRNFRLDSGYPRNLPRAFQRVRGAMQWRDGGIYLFRGSQYMRWSEGLTDYSSGYPRETNTFWQGMPSSVSSIFMSRDGHAYAFKGRRYYRFDPRARLTPGFPKDFRPLWLNCPNPRRYRRRRPQQITEADYSFLTTVEASP